MGGFSEPPPNASELFEIKNPPEHAYSIYKEGEWVLYKPNPDTLSNRKELIEYNDSLFLNLLKFSEQVKGQLISNKEQFLCPPSPFDILHGIKTQVSIDASNNFNRDLVKQEIQKLDTYKKSFQEFYQRIFNKEISENLEPNHREFIIARHHEFMRIQAENYLMSLTMYLLMNSDTSVKESVQLFARDLRTEPADYYGTLWLYGISLENEKYELTENITLRRPTSIDISVKYPAALTNIIPNFNDNDLYKNTAIFEFKMPKITDMDAHIPYAILRIILPLYKPASVGMLSYTYRAEGILTPGSHYLPSSISNLPAIFGDIDHRVLYPINFSQKDVEPFNKFYKHMAHIIYSTIEESTPLHKTIRIALDRYRKALLGREENENRITYAVNSLEALFINENDEISYKFRQRITLFYCLLFPEIDFNELLALLKKSYTIRSKYIHGDFVPLNKTLSKEELLKMFDVNRVCLVAFYQLKDSFDNDKTSFIKLIDNAFIDLPSLEKLKLNIKNCVLVN